MLALIASFGIVELAKERKWVLFIVILFIFINGIWHSIPTLKAKSGYLEAMTYMKAHKGVKHFSSIPTISRCYIGIKMSIIYRKKSLNEIKWLYSQGFNYLLLDQDRYVYSSNIFVREANLVKPVFETPHATDIFLYEGYSPQIRKKIKSEPKVLRVYDMGEILKSIKCKL